MYQCDRLGTLEIQRDRTMAAAQYIGRAVLSDVGTLGAAAGTVNPNDIGAHIGQDHSAEGHRTVLCAGHLDHAEAT